MYKLTITKNGATHLEMTGTYWECMDANYDSRCGLAWWNVSGAEVETWHAANHLDASKITCTGEIVKIA